jgi:hypothetical protein
MNKFINSTYLGETRKEDGNDIAVDSTGNAYMIGEKGTHFNCPIAGYCKGGPA